MTNLCESTYMRAVQHSGAGARRHPKVTTLDDLPLVLTVDEAATVLRISRAAAYEQARIWRETDGREGLPVVVIGRSLRVPKAALEDKLRCQTIDFSWPFWPEAVFCRSYARTPAKGMARGGEFSVAGAHFSSPSGHRGSPPADEAAGSGPLSSCRRPGGRRGVCS